MRGRRNYDRTTSLVAYGRSYAGAGPTHGSGSLMDRMKERYWERKVARAERMRQRIRSIQPRVRGHLDRLLIQQRYANRALERAERGLEAARE